MKIRNRNPDPESINNESLNRDDLPRGWIIVHDMERHDREVPINGALIGTMRPYKDRTIVSAGGLHTHTRESMKEIFELISMSGVV